LFKIRKCGVFFIILLFPLILNFAIVGETTVNKAKVPIKGLVKVGDVKSASDINTPEINGIVKYEEIFADTLPPAGWQSIDGDSSGNSWSYSEGIVLSWGDSIQPQAGIAFWANSYQNANGTDIDDWLITPRLPVIESGDSLYVWINAIGISTITIYPDTLTIWVSLQDSLVNSFNLPVDTIIDPGPAGEWHRYALDITVNNQIVGNAPFVGFKHDHRNGGQYGSGSNGVYLDHVILTNGGFATPIVNQPNSTPSGFVLEQNYPNPFNPSTTIAYQLAKESEVSLIVYNLAGQEVKTLVNERQSAGPQQVVWDGKDLHGNQVASGIYLYRLKTENNIQTRKMILMK